MEMTVARGTTGRKAQKDQEEIRKRMEEMECHEADTTGLDYFAECLVHLAKNLLHSAMGLPSAALGKQDTRKKSDGEEGFACLFSDTRQRVCHV